MDASLPSPLVPSHIPAWATGAVYQLLVPSYQDSDGDGMGDLPGLISRLDYLQWLGVQALWLSPIYPSPLLDMGYDVADYLDVNPRFGTLGDFDRLIREAERRDLHVLLDFVPNHTSHAHPWFRESRSSRNSPKRDWYIWHDGAPGGGPPNNWTQQYEISDWAWDDVTRQYYMHSFTPEQPDLNYQNREVRTAMKEVLRFWLDRGVAGFRIDAMVHLYKDRLLRDNPPAEGSSIDEWPAWNMLPAYTQDCGGVQEILQDLLSVVGQYRGRILIGENHLPSDRLQAYYRSGVTLPANAQLLDLEWEPIHIRRGIDRYEGYLTPADWPNWHLGTHDNERVASHLGVERARVAAMMQLTLRGTAIIYYGEEIGMHNVDVPPDKEVDVLAKRLPGRGMGRDRQRTPMQWSSGRHADFTRGEPWLPLPDDYAVINVERQREDRSSMLTLYRRLLHLRRENDALRVGHYIPDVIDNRALAYQRDCGTSRVLVALNFTDATIQLEPRASGGRILLSTHLDREGVAVDSTLQLRANEGVVVELSCG